MDRTLAITEEGRERGGEIEERKEGEMEKRGKMEGREGTEGRIIAGYTIQLPSPVKMMSLDTWPTAQLLTWSWQ